MKPFTKTFEGDNFRAYTAACDWCREHGISYGSMSAPDPTALIRGDVLIAKWKNLTAKERAQVDGTITTVTDYRNGPVTVTLKEAP